MKLYFFSNLSKFLLLFLCLFSAKTAFADTLFLSDVYKMLWANHPLAKQAALIPELFAQDVRYARGFFDPTIAADWYKKEFKGKTYYNKFIAEAKIPTYLGFDIKGGFESQSGDFINPENNVPDEGLAYLGVSVPLMRSLFFDERRANLVQAKIFHQMSFADKQKSLANLFWEVTNDYWNWYAAFERKKVNESGIILAQKRFEFVVAAYRGGKYAAIDTTEALMEYRRRLVDFEKSVIDLNNASLEISMHLYNENEEIMLVSPEILPSKTQKVDIDAISKLKENALPNHPEILKNQLKQDANKISEKLAFFNLLPVVDLEYKPLFLATSPNISTSNYKLGANIYLPLFLRKERAKLASTKIKIKQQSQEINFVKQKVMLYFDQVFNEYTGYKRIFDAQNGNVESAKTLTSAEEEKFSLGISNVFLINYRERYLLDNQIKLIDIEAKYQSLFAKLFYAAGTFPSMTD